MAIIKCKMCGGDLALVEGSTIATCEYCGTTQTVPSLDNEKKLNLFERANRLRASCEFDKAAGIYESIVTDFPEEAEAYWGLVLCKYGIEYVDDPATGKKIPTCHRSSFESVREDNNLGLTLENADTAARKLYQEEAKQIEQLRKDIIEVSAKEDPYDIFICYKETDEKGERTLDSVLAQDVYDALTDEGYRVFFSRITLEDKIGQEYEPYIFAALNSAKVMLVVGTSFDHYNAVWVKNEWSRFLKLMETDKDKYLIPCFKDIDAYDMPREFVRLQAQDLGKVGAMQDLLRGIDKLLPKKETRSIVIQQGVMSNTEALLKRGTMALEDREWAAADEFFEEVLNQNAECAEAYIGKALAQRKCQTLDELGRQMLSNVQTDCSQTQMSIPASAVRIAKAVEQYAIPGVLEEWEIRKLYEFDRNYYSDVAKFRSQKEAIQKCWSQDKNLARAQRFADGETAMMLNVSKNKLFDSLEQRIENAQKDQEAKRAALQARYDKFLDDADEKAAQERKFAESSREEQYETLVRTEASCTDAAQFVELADGYTKLGDFRDCPERAQNCRQLSDKWQAQQKAYQELLEIQNRQLFKKFRLVMLILLAIGSVAMGLGVGDTSSDSGIIGNIISAAIVEAIIAAPPAFLACRYLRSKKNSNFLRKLFKFFAVLGVVVWTAGLFHSIFGEGASVARAICCAANASINLWTLVFPYSRKTI